MPVMVNPVVLMCRVCGSVTMPVCTKKKASQRDKPSPPVFLLIAQDGLESTRQIRSFEAMLGVTDKERNYIVALTAHSSDEDKRDCRDAGMQSFMSKPITPQVRVALCRSDDAEPIFARCMTRLAAPVA